MVAAEERVSAFNRLQVNLIIITPNWNDIVASCKPFYVKLIMKPHVVPKNEPSQA